jgi:hypothetical protein
MADIFPFSYQGLPSWQVRIIQDYPRIYLEPDPLTLGDLRDRRYNPHAPFYCNLRLGFEGCKIGWEKLITQLSAVAESLREDLQSSGRQPKARITAFIVKEKFGGLRFQGTNNLVNPYRFLFVGYVQSVEYMSQTTCGFCGRPGRIRNLKGWDTAICDQDYDRLTNS